MEISPEELHARLQPAGSGAVRLIDVREPDEYDICHLEGAELIPLGTFSEKAAGRLPDKGETIVVYCHHGMRSDRAAQWLRSMGYQAVYNLTGGIDAWADLVEPSMRRY